MVDDERDVALMIQLMLKQDEHEVDAATDGAEALAALGVEPKDASRPLPDLVLMDVMMPVLDGYDACARACGDPRASSVPVILMTARGAAADPQRRTANVAAHLDKPFDPRALRRLVADTLGGRA